MGQIASWYKKMSDFSLEMKRAKKLSFATLITRKKADALEINDFPWTHERTEIGGQTSTLKYGERQVLAKKDGANSM